MANIDRQAADGFNNAAGLASLTANKQGVSGTGLRYARYIMLADGSMKGDGALSETLVFTDQTQAQYEALLSKLGLTTALSSVSNEITYRTLSTRNRSTLANYNAIVNHQGANLVNDLYPVVEFTFLIVEAL